MILNLFKVIFWYCKTIVLKIENKRLFNFHYNIKKLNLIFNKEMLSQLLTMMRRFKILLISSVTK